MANSIPRQNPNNINRSRLDAKVALGVCPLSKPTLQLVPLRYGLVDNPALDPATALSMPYRLSSRPLGVRLPRDGWLYVIDSATGELSEYRLLDGLLTQLLLKSTTVTEDERQTSIGPPHLIVSRHSTLYVTYAETQWTARKCQQVLNSAEERTHFMQAVHPGLTNCQTGGTHLLTPQMAEQWLAEVATEYVDYHQQHLDQTATLAEHAAFAERQRQLAKTPEHERQPYLWEQPRRFQQISMGTLARSVAPEYHHDILYLVLDDTLGVLRDLANYQDEVVGWVTDWANGGAQKGHNERNYLLGCYIESLTWLAESDWQTFAATLDDPAIQALLEDFKKLPEPERAVTGKALHEYLNRGGLMTPPPNTSIPADLEALRHEAEIDIVQFQASAPDQQSLALHALQETDRRYYTRAHFRVAPAAFVEAHFEALITLGNQRSRDTQNILFGARFGQRGVNELIDRPAMDRELQAHRDGLERWNRVLDSITADRVALITRGAFHNAAWYFDAQQAGQVGHAFSLEYACLKDICRSDEACDQLLAYLEGNPQFVVRLYYTLPISEQTALWVQYAFLLASSVAVYNNLPEQLARLDTLERGRLPALDELPESTRNVAHAAQHAWSPALNRRLESLVASFDGIVKGNTMPDLDQLFRDLPQALTLRILQAAKTEGATFHFASPAERDSLRETLKEVLDQRERLLKLKHKRQQVNRVDGHRSLKSQQLLHEINTLRGQLTQGEARLAASISPIPELPDEHVRLFGSAPGRAGMTVIFAPEGHRQVASLMSNFKEGVHRAPVMNVLGDGAALLLFFAQMVNLNQVLKETLGVSREDRQFLPYMSSLTATGAAGFAAAQGVFDTALNAQAKKLKADLRMTSLNRLEVSLGKLHVGLGFATYIFGFFSALIGYNNYRNNWIEAVRSGNTAAQLSSALTMSSAGGLALSNAYGMSHTTYATYLSMKAPTGAAREAAWLASGKRLSTVFFRFSLAGGLFTLLELAGTWMYNHYNTSAHDQWLQSTPWGLETDKQKNLSLAGFQSHLQALLQAPFVQVKRRPERSYLAGWFPATQVGEITINLPGLNLQDFQAPLGGQPPHGLKVGARRFITVLDGGRRPRKYAQELSEPVQAGLFRVETGAPNTPGLRLNLSYPNHPERINGKLHEELLLELQLMSLDEQGQPVVRSHLIHFNPFEEGRYPSAAQPLPSPALTLLAVDVLALKEIPDA
ncbi:toxin VasX [Pseudomonas lundensis]|uniref:toxin VasX n=1 Tax=Pseudomonas lundensis TaxID=86185 RepID=UPI004045C9A6